MAVVSGTNSYAKEMEIRRRMEAIDQYMKGNAEQITIARARKAEELAAVLAARKGQVSTQNDIELGQYAPTLAGGQPRPMGIGLQPLPVGGRPDMQGVYAMDDEDMVRFRAERGGRAGGWSIELSEKRALEEAFPSICV